MERKTNIELISRVRRSDGSKYLLIPSEIAKEENIEERDNVRFEIKSITKAKKCL